MATNQSFDSIKIGVCDCFWRPVPTDANPNPTEIYLGLTKGGCELNYTPEWKEIQVDQFGKTASESVLIGETVKVKVPLAETDLEKLELFSHTGTKEEKEQVITTLNVPGGITGVTNAPTSANTTAGAAGVPQVETTIVLGGATADGNVDVIVNAVGMPNTPKTVSVAVLNGDTADQVAQKIRTALAGDVDVGAFFNVSGTTDNIILTRTVAAADDGTININIQGGLTGVPDDTTSVHAVVGSVGTLQVETATVAGTVTDTGNITVTVTASGMTNSPKAVTVAVVSGDTANQVATKIRTALGLDANVSGFFTISGANADIILTKKTSGANDATLNIAIDGGSVAATSIGATQLPLTSVTGLFVGDRIKVGVEYSTIVSISGNIITLKDALTATHNDGDNLTKVKPRLTFGRRPGFRLAGLAGRIRLHPISMGHRLTEDVVIHKAINRAPLQLNYKLDEERIFQTEFNGIVPRQTLEDELAGVEGSFLWQIGNPSI